MSLPTAGGESELGGGGVLSKAPPLKVRGLQSKSPGKLLAGQALPEARVRPDGLTQSLQTAAQADGPANALISPVIPDPPWRGW